MIVKASFCYFCYLFVTFFEKKIFTIQVDNAKGNKVTQVTRKKSNFQKSFLRLGFWCFLFVTLLPCYLTYINIYNIYCKIEKIRLLEEAKKGNKKVTKVTKTLFSNHKMSYFCTQCAKSYLFCHPPDDL